jgi:hypothetical protein
MTSYSIGKLYLIPTTMGDCDPMDVLPEREKNYRFQITTSLKMKKQL